MIDFEHLYRGLCGMANAPRAGSMAGHLGAALVAGYFIGEEHPELDPGVVGAIERDLGRIAGGEESIWFDPQKAGITAAELFEPLPEEDVRVVGAADRIAAALRKNIGAMRQSGHNSIFASIAIRALREHPEFATPKLVAGIGRLIASFDQQHAGRGYYGKARGWLIGEAAPLADDAETPSYENLEKMAEVVIDELIGKASQHRRGFGGLFHLVNHAASLIELERCGYPALALEGLPAHRQHLRLYRALPDLEAELGVLQRTDADPSEPAYWKRTESVQWGAWLTHRIKTLYGFHTVLGLVGDGDRDGDRRERAISQFGYLLA